MTTVLPSMGRDFRSPSVVAVAVCHRANSMASTWSTPVCELLPKAGSRSGGRSWFLAVSTLVLGEAFHVSCGPQLVIDLEVCPACVSSLSSAVSEGNMLAVNRRWPAMFCTIILGESLAWRGWTMQTVSKNPGLPCWIISTCIGRSNSLKKRATSLSASKTALGQMRVEMSCRSKFPLSRIVKRNSGDFPLSLIRIIYIHFLGQ